MRKLLILLFALAAVAMAGPQPAECQSCAGVCWDNSDCMFYCACVGRGTGVGHCVGD